MDVQRALLSRLIRDGDIVKAVNARVTPEFFTDDKYRRVFEYMLDHWRRYSTPADIGVVASAFPSYEWPEYEQTSDYFIDELRQRRKRVLLLDVMSEAITLLNTSDEPDALNSAEEILQDGMIKLRLETSSTADYDFTQREDLIFDRLDERAANPGIMRGIPTGFRGIDFVTGGFQPEQLIVMIGLPKSMKSSTMLKMAMNVHDKAARIPLFVGFEMSNEEQEDRMISLLSGLSLTDVMNGYYNLREEERIHRAVRLFNSGRAFVTSADLSSTTTVSGVQAKIMEFQPDVVFIDGAYMMHSEIPKVEQGSAQALTDVARGLKRLAQSQKTCIVVSTQASSTRAKGGLNMFSPMYTQAWGQSADVLLGVERVDPTASDFDPVAIRLKVLASRSGPRSETLLMWDWNHGRVDEMERRKEDTAEDDG